MSAVQRLQIGEMNALCADEGWFPGLMARVSDGESLYDLARERLWSYGVLRNWIASDESREAALIEAEKYRSQRVEGEVYKVALASVPISESSKMKALDMLRRPAASGLTINGGAGGVNINVAFVAARDGKELGPIDVTPVIESLGVREAEYI